MPHSIFKDPFERRAAGQIASPATARAPHAERSPQNAPARCAHKTGRLPPRASPPPSPRHPPPLPNPAPSSAPRRLPSGRATASWCCAAATSRRACSPTARCAVARARGGGGRGQGRPHTPARASRSSLFSPCWGRPRGAPPPPAPPAPVLVADHHASPPPCPPTAARPRHAPPSTQVTDIVAIPSNKRAACADVMDKAVGEEPWCVRRGPASSRCL